MPKSQTQLIHKLSLSLSLCVYNGSWWKTIPKLSFSLNTHLHLTGKSIIFLIFSFLLFPIFKISFLPFISLWFFHLYYDFKYCIELRFQLSHHFVRSPCSHYEFVCIFLFLFLGFSCHWLCLIWINIIVFNFKIKILIRPINH